MNKSLKIIFCIIVLISLVISGSVIALVWSLMNLAQ